jgi:hypothetical protein
VVTQLVRGQHPNLKGIYSKIFLSCWPIVVLSGNILNL